MYLADLHIHSHYARATSRDCDPVHLDLWARKKGLSLLGTGDFTHPAWRAELEEALVPAEEGLYTLRESLRQEHFWGGKPPRFVLSGEISSIYKKNGKTRKVHSVILLPSLEAAANLSHRLEAIGNIHSDGRPILGLDCRDLLELTLEACPEAVFIPAHIWTPHFSLFGAFSGFDSIEECFEDLTPHIHALETGLSSDPPMNWRVSQLDRFTLVSNSDAHSPAKLGREANLLETGISYPELKTALETGRGFAGTLEFFPEEGKYHLDGHRNCGVRLTPAETEAYGGKCPVCGKRLTIGVEHRVEDLSDREEGYLPEHRKPFESLAPLPEVIAASTGVSEGSKKTQACYEELLRALGPEFYILREAPFEEVAKAAGPAVAEGLRRLRAGKVLRQAGYDGEFGRVQLLTPSEIEAYHGQVSLFGAASLEKKKKSPALQKLSAAPSTASPAPAASSPNPEQLAAASASQAVIAVAAGPGTGKTKTLTDRILFLLSQGGAKPSEITAVTFTREAAREMRERLAAKLGKRSLAAMTINTFHAICFAQLGNPPLIGTSEAVALAEEVFLARGKKLSPHRLLQAVSQMKNGAAQRDPKIPTELLEAYQEALTGKGLLDLDDLLRKGLSQPPKKPKAFTHLLIDEFQDCNQLQYDLALAWSKNAKSLFVIGDPDQSIYGFRGALGNCFSQLRADFPGLREIRLTRNYRSTPEILGSALAVISQNPGGPRELSAQGPSGEKVCLFTGGDEFSEAIFLAKEVARRTGGMDMLSAQGATEPETTLAFSEIAILCRTHRQLELIERSLRREDIPCVIVGREDFLDKPLVQGTLAFFRFLSDPRDLESLKSCLKLLWNCPGSAISSALSALPLLSGQKPENWQEALGDIPALSQFLRMAAEYFPLLSQKPEKLLERWKEQWPQESSLRKLQNMAAFHQTLPEFLTILALGEEGDLRRASGTLKSSGAVRLMTFHGAKGLEFPLVFLAGASQGKLPLEAASGTAEGQEEERRLFYVGMTRAQKELVISAPGVPSPFLQVLPEALLRTSALPKRERPAEQLSLFGP